MPLHPHVPDSVGSPEAGLEPEDEALLADAVGLALLVEAWWQPRRWIELLIELL